MQNDVENVITFLKNKRGIKIKTMMEAVGVERGGFLSWRMSPNQGRRDELARLLKIAFKEQFEEPDEKEHEPNDQKKYVRLLEVEIERLRKENERLLDWLEKKLEALSYLADRKE